VCTHRNKVKAVAVVTPDFQPLTAGQLTQPIESGYVHNASGLEDLYSAGVTDADIAASFAWLLSGGVKEIRVNEELPMAQQLPCVASLIVNPHSARMGLSHEVSKAPGQGALVLCSDVRDVEAVATCGILMELLQHASLGTTIHLLCDHASLSIPKDCQFVHILTKGALECPTMVRAMVKSERLLLTYVVVTVEGFSFPDEEYYKMDLPSLMDRRKTWFDPDPHVRLADLTALQTIFRQLSVPFAPEGALPVLTAQATEVMDRLCRNSQLRLTTVPSTAVMQARINEVASQPSSHVHHTPSLAADASSKEEVNSTPQARPSLVRWADNPPAAVEGGNTVSDGNFLSVVVHQDEWKHEF